MYDRMGDEAVAARAQAGDGMAAEWLITKFRLVVLFKSQAYFMPGSERDDMIQEGMIGLFKAIRDFRADQDCSFRTFADVCITRQMITAVKSAMYPNKSFGLHAASLDVRMKNGDASITLGELLPSDAKSPEEIVTAREGARAMVAALRTLLSEFEMEAVSRFTRGDSYHEISAALGPDHKSVDNALCRVRRKARRWVEEAN